jgi:hypothetical protein
MPLISRGFHGGHALTSMRPGSLLDSMWTKIPGTVGRSHAERAVRPVAAHRGRGRWPVALLGPSRPSAAEDSLGTRRPRRQVRTRRRVSTRDHRSRSSRSRTRPRCHLGAPAAGHRDCRLRRRPGHGADIEWGRTPALGLPQTQYQRPIDPRHRSGYSHREERLDVRPRPACGRSAR